MQNTRVVHSFLPESIGEIPSVIPWLVEGHTGCDRQSAAPHLAPAAGTDKEQAASRSLPPQRVQRSPARAHAAYFRTAKSPCAIRSATSSQLARSFLATVAAQQE